MTLVPIETGELLDPRTGELLNLRNVPLVNVAQVRQNAKDPLDQARQVVRACEDELETRHREGLIADAPFPVKRGASWMWDASLTHEALAQLVADDVISPAEADALVPETMVRKPDGRALKSLLSRLMASDLDAAALLQRGVQERVSWKVELPADGGEA